MKQVNTVKAHCKAIEKLIILQDETHMFRETQPSLRASQPQ